MSRIIETDLGMQGKVVGGGFVANPGAIEREGVEGCGSGLEKGYVVYAALRRIGRESVVVRRIQEEEMLLKLAIKGRVGRGVQVAHQQKGLLPAACFFHDDRDACHAVFACKAEMGAGHDIALELCY